MEPVTVETVEAPEALIVPNDVPNEAPIEAPVEVLEAVEVPELVYTYQPSDEKGRPLGGKQVIKYKTTDELTQKLTEQNIQLVRKLREESRKAKLGIVDDIDDIPEDAPKFTQAIEFKPRQLSPDERYQLSKDLLDPEKCEEATNTLLEARLGARPEDVSTVFNKIAQDNMRIMAKVESDAFLVNNPSYFPCRENFDTLTGYMLRKNLEPTRENFQLAYEKLNSANLFVTRVENEPVSVQEPIEPVVIPIVEPVEVIEPIVEAAPKRTAPPPTGLTNSRTGESNVIPNKYKFTLEQINNMPSEEYKKRLLHEKGFAEMVDSLEKEHIQSRKK